MGKCYPKAVFTWLRADNLCCFEFYRTAIIYNNLKEDEKEDFIGQWKVLEKEATEANESIQRLFYYYMFYLRAKEGDVSSTTPGVRKYYLAGKCERLYDKNLMSELNTVLDLWKVINTNHDIPEESWDNNPKIRKALDTLVSYPNEFWKYPVINFYLAHRTKSNFDKEFLFFLNKLIGELLTRFILYPTINAVKSDIMKLNARVVKKSHPEFEFRQIDMDSVKDKIKVAHRNIVRMLLKIYAYNHQENLLPDNWQIEHILPQKWQTTFFPDIEDRVVSEMIEHIGNKTPFERKLNIIASNGYFKKKQEEYIKSNVEVTKILVTSIDSDWTIGNIEHRDNIITSEMMELLANWNTQYDNCCNITEKDEPTKEDLEKIKKYKELGWI